MKLTSVEIDLNSTASQDLLAGYEGEGIVTGAAVHSFSETPNAGDANSIAIRHSPTDSLYLSLGITSISHPSKSKVVPVSGNPPKIGNGEGVYAKVDQTIGYPCTAIIDLLGYPITEISE